MMVIILVMMVMVTVMAVVIFAMVLLSNLTLVILVCKFESLPFGRSDPSGCCWRVMDRCQLAE